MPKMSQATILAFAVSVLISFSSLFRFSGAQTSTLRPGHYLNFTGELKSPNGIFKLAFFTPDTGTSFLGISVPSQGDKNVWVANRILPIYNTNARFTMDAKGVLAIVQAGHASFPLNAESAAVNSVASLEDTGNFVVSELNSNGSVKGVLWQSFDYPTDTLLPLMKLGKNYSTGKAWSLTSWLTDTNPAPGVFSLEWDLNVNDTLELIMKHRGEVYWTGGMLERGNRNFQNLPFTNNGSRDDYLFHSTADSSGSSLFYTIERDTESWWQLEPSGRLSAASQTVLLTENICLGISSSTPGCYNTKGTPRCRNKGDKFEAMTGYFEHDEFQYNDRGTNKILLDCWAVCWRQCDCIAYKLVEDSFCQYWGGQAKFIPNDSTIMDYYVLTSLPSSKENRLWLWLIVGLVAAVLVLLFGFSVYYRRKKLIEERERNEEEILIELTTSDQLNESGQIGDDGRRGRSRSVKVFSFASIQVATKDFSIDNKVGQGGFGPVYKGRLPDGEEIAVKRLSSGSGQGIVEFKNEIILIAKLQHMNLVRLLGCCIFKDEKMLIYEYMHNKSLDFFLFDSTIIITLAWKTRFSIIEGIAQGLLYLHRYSRLRIIHRDLKASNILLDENMVPKISDFGMAKIFSREATKALTNRVVGTYGYMAPEYAMEGVFSDKSDVYSFGVLLLEIISGRRNSSFHEHDVAISLVAYAWKTWNDRICLDIMDPTFVEPPREQILRCIHIALLCVQDDAADRPNMADTVLMLSSESLRLPEPNEPAYQSSKLKTRGNQPCKNESEIHSLISITTVPEAR